MDGSRCWLERSSQEHVGVCRMEGTYAPMPLKNIHTDRLHRSFFRGCKYEYALLSFPVLPWLFWEAFSMMLPSKAYNTTTGCTTNTAK